jgi:hypothetical protein
MQVNKNPYGKACTDSKNSCLVSLLVSSKYHLQASKRQGPKDDFFLECAIDIHGDLDCTRASHFFGVQIQNTK